MKDVPLIPVIYLHKLLDVMQEEGIPVKHLMQEWTVDMELIRNNDAYVSYAQMDTIVSAYLKITTNPNPGLTYGLQLDLLTHGLLGYTYCFRGSYYELIRNIVTYMNVRAPLLELSIHKEKEYFSVQINCGNIQTETRSFLLQTFMTSFYKLGSLLIPNIHIYTESRLFSHCPQLKDKIPAPIVEGNTCNELRYYIDTHPSPMPALALETPPSLPNFILKLRQYLLHHCENLASASQAAAYLNMSERTLRRRLSDFGYSYRSIRQEISMNTALRYLQNTSLSIERIASKCGYSDQASFTHAFQKWRGATPGAERNKAQQNRKR